MNKSESTAILHQIDQYYSSTFEKGARLLIGVSGGPDSMALLYMMQKLSVPLLAVHINYGKRGAESDADQQLVEDMCSMWGIECCSVRLSADEANGNFQEWARDQRYQIFRDLKREYKAAGITIAHHQDDQLETVLFKMLRGGGIGSWRGLQVWDGELFRPLLQYPKKEILHFCEVESVPFRVDESNQSDEYMRNALRNMVFSVFEGFIPGWRSNLLEISGKSAITDEALEMLLNSVISEDEIQVEVLKRVSRQMAGELIRRFFERKFNSSVSKGQIAEILHLLGSEVGKKIEISSSLSMVREREHLRVSQKTEGEIFSIEIIKIRAEEGFKYKDWSFLISENKRASYLNVDAEIIQWPVLLRKWKEGDKFEPLGLNGIQKISDHLTNRKISASKKEDSLILIDSGGTICAILYPEVAVNGEFGCISECVKLTGSTKQVLSIFK